MSAIKKFFQKKKLDMKLVKAGPGHRLGDESTTVSSQNARNFTAHPTETVRKTSECIESSARAHDAAMLRMNAQNAPSKSSKLTQQMHAERQLAIAEQKELEKALELSEKVQSPRTVNLEKPSALYSVLFHCPQLCFDESDHEGAGSGGGFSSSSQSFVGDFKSVELHIKQLLEAEQRDNPLEASALIVHSLSSDASALENTLKTLRTLLQNLLDHPTEQKYHRIRLSNPKIVETLVCQNGAIDFLKAIGFEQFPKTSEEQEGEKEKKQEEDPCLIISERAAADADRIRHALLTLNNAEPIKPKLYTNTRVYSRSKRMAVQEDLSTEFFSLNRHELLREIELQKRAIEESAMLLTKKMRDNLRIKEKRVYRYCLIRVRFPDELQVEGTFRARDPVSEVHAWLQQLLEFSFLPYRLTSPGNRQWHSADLPLQLEQQRKQQRERQEGPQQQESAASSCTSSSASPGSGGVGASWLESLSECDLVPCALLAFAFDEASASGKQSHANTIVYLKSHWMKRLE